MNTLEVLMKRAEQSKDDKLHIKKVKCNALACEITLKKPSITKFANIMDEARNSENMMEELRSDAAILYEAWPLVKENIDKLMEAYMVSDPYDAILKIFENNITEMSELAGVVVGMFGINSEIKN